MSSLNGQELIFAMDIGTRTVVGVVGVQEGENFRVLAAEIEEHKSRAMLDGQVHDIEKVALVAGTVKSKLEKKLDVKLDKVAVAAAGRVLKTKQVRVDREINSAIEIDKELVGSLEMEGLQLAQYQLEQELSDEEKTQYYCVGYSVVNYYLNGYVISALQGHRGKVIGAEILTTFLPHVVVDGLYTVMDRIGLEVGSLTLEPIAAINVAIPKELRLLNLAMVDIGAGTSDIAITKNGSVVAYAMAPIAGDEITETISHEFLVDFNTADKIKLALSGTKESVTFKDIMGIKQTKKVSEINALIRPAVEQLAHTISEKILEYNKKSPNAVFLIGGGSLIGGLAPLVAQNLELPKERVAVRDRTIIQNIKISGKKLSGPDAITPIGIAVTAQMQQGHDFLVVSVNNRKIKLFNSRALNVADALILVGFNPNALIGRSGKALIYSLNGEKKVVRGGFGKPAEIFVNGQQASLETVLKYGDDITINSAEDGTPARLTAIDALEIHGGKSILINGSSVLPDTLIQEGDSVEIIFEKPESTENEETVTGMTNEEDTSAAGLADANIAEDAEDAEKAVEEDARAEEVPIEEAPIEEAPIEEVTSDTIRFIVNGSPVVLTNNKKQYIFVDIFNHINFDLNQPKGNIVLKLNGVQAAFTDEINNNDRIDIYWDE